MNSDDVIVKQIHSVIDTAYCGAVDEWRLLSVLELKWQRLKPGRDSAGQDMAFIDKSDHIGFVAKSLVSDHIDIAVITDSMLYTENNLMSEGKDTSISPDDFTEPESTPIKLDDDLPKNILDALIRIAKKNDDTFMQIIANHEDCDAYIEAVKNPDLKQAMKIMWEKGKEEYID